MSQRTWTKGDTAVVGPNYRVKEWRGKTVKVTRTLSDTIGAVGERCPGDYVVEDETGASRIVREVDLVNSPPDSDLAQLRQHIADLEAECNAKGAEITDLKIDRRMRLEDIRARIQKIAILEDTCKTKDAEIMRLQAKIKESTISIQKGLDDAYKVALIDREIAKALVIRPLKPGAPAQLIAMWRQEFRVTHLDDMMEVVTKIGNYSAAYIARHRLNTNEYAHFLAK